MEPSNTFQLITTDNKEFIISSQSASQWEFFDALLAGRFASSDLKVDFTLQELQYFNNIIKYLETGKQHPVRYQDIIEQVIFFGPKSNKWAITVIVDENTFSDSNDAKEWYENVGYTIRDEGKPLGFIRHTEDGLIPYESITSRPGPLYNNFTLVLDPIYNFTLINHRNEQIPIYEDISKTDPKQYEEERIESLDLTMFNILTGIMNSSYLKSLEKNVLTYLQEVPWYFVPWKYVGMFVASEYDNYNILWYIRRKYFDKLNYKPISRSKVLYYIDDRIEEPLFSQAALINNAYPEYKIEVDPDVSIHSRGEIDIFDNAGTIIGIRGGRVSTNLDMVDDVSLYTIFNNAMVDTASEMSNNESKLYDRITECGLVPLVASTKYDNEDFVDTLRGTRGGFFAAEALVPFVNLMIVYQGKFKRKNGKYVTTPVNEAKFKEVIEYGLKTVGSEAMESIATLLITYYFVSKNKKAFKFSQLVKDIVGDRVIPPSHLP